MEHVLGQIGLVLTAIFGIAVLQKTNRILPRPGWPYFVSIWVVAVIAALLLSKAIVSVSYYRLAVGLMLTSVYYRYQAAGIVPHDGVMRVIVSYFNKPISISAVTRINRYLWSGIGALLLLSGVYWFRDWQQAQTATLMREVRKTGAVANRAVRTATDRTKEMQVTIDSLTSQLSQVRADDARGKQQVEALQKQIAVLTDLIVDLKRLIRKVGSNVERTRRSGISTPPTLLPNSSYFQPIPSDIVKPLPASVPRRKGKYGCEGCGEDSTHIASYINPPEL